MTVECPHSPALEGEPGTAAPFATLRAPTRRPAPHPHPLPALGLPVHETVGSVPDDAGDPDPDAEDRGRADPAAGQYRLKPGQNRLDDQADSVLPGITWIVGLGALGQGQVKQLDADPGLANVDPYDVPVIRVHLQQGARTDRKST